VVSPHNADSTSMMTFAEHPLWKELKKTPVKPYYGFHSGGTRWTTSSAKARRSRAGGSRRAAASITSLFTGHDHPCLDGGRRTQDASGADGEAWSLRSDDGE
jgi:hypothetical protein